jgi:hypothetical protein
MMMKADQEEKIELKSVGIFKVIRQGRLRDAYLYISKEILRIWENLGYNTDNLYVVVQVEEKSGVLGIAPLSPDEVIQAKMSGWRIVGPSREKAQQDEKKEVR